MTENTKRRVVIFFTSDGFYHVYMDPGVEVLMGHEEMLEYVEYKDKPIEDWLVGEAPILLPPESPMSSIRSTSWCSSSPKNSWRKFPGWKFSLVPGTPCRGVGMNGQDDSSSWAAEKRWRGACGMSRSAIDLAK